MTTQFTFMSQKIPLKKRRFVTISLNLKIEKMPMII